MTEFKEKLINLKILLPRYQEGSPIYGLGLHLVNYLRNQHDSLGYLTAAATSIDDLASGYDSITGEKISSPLIGLHESFYLKLLNEDLVEITTKIFPTDFANEVIYFIKAISDEKLEEEIKLATTSV